MTVPNIDTFENDIREEIKNKEASVGDIASAGGVIANAAMPSLENNKMSRFLLAFLVIAGIGIVGGFSYLAYVYLDSQPTSKEEAEALLTIETQNQNTERLVAEKLRRIAPSLVGMARFSSEVLATPPGTAVKLVDYSPVFAFMLGNEEKIAKEVFAEEFASHTGTTTLEIIITDETKSNQNMRILSVASSSLVYAFFGEDYLAFASSTDDILRMRGVIIK